MFMLFMLVVLQAGSVQLTTEKMETSAACRQAAEEINHEGQTKVSRTYAWCEVNN